MGWKEWPGWVKGAIAGFFAPLVIVLLLQEKARFVFTLPDMVLRLIVPVGIQEISPETNAGLLLGLLALCFTFLFYSALGALIAVLLERLFKRN